MSNSTPEDGLARLVPQIRQILLDVAGSDPADSYRRNEAGEAIEELILADRKAQGTAILEKLLKNGSGGGNWRRIIIGELEKLK